MTFLLSRLSVRLRGCGLVECCTHSIITIYTYIMWTIILLTLSLPALAQNNLSFQQYLTGLGDTLKANGMGIVSNALGSVNGSVSGAALLDTLYRGSGFTFFAPVDAVCSHHLTPSLTRRHGMG